MVTMAELVMGREKTVSLVMCDGDWGIVGECDGDCEGVGCSDGRSGAFSESVPS